mmetsp:Transcript_42575/g.65312  ORF Transcript_42575/g.65312 Transcript_42575/m.65312 type:complete len:127 (+) Transcript_42575:1227-1607(+)
MQDPYLLVPDVKSNEKLANYVRVFEKLIDQCLRTTKKEIVNINQFMFIFERRLDNIIINLKKATSKLQPDGSDNEEHQEEEVNNDPKQTASDEYDEEDASQKESEEEDSYGGDDDGEDADEDLAAD